jgi:hypothetical protein
MPTYTYRCSEGHEFDDVRSVASRDEPTSCSRPLYTPRQIVKSVGSEEPIGEVLGRTITCDKPAERVEIPSGRAAAYVKRPGVGDRSPFSRDRVGK